MLTVTPPSLSLLRPPLQPINGSQDYHGPIPSMIPGQPPLLEPMGERVTLGGRLRAGPSPLGPNLAAGKPPSLSQLYAAIVCPERGWLDALQVMAWGIALMRLLSWLWL